MSINNIVKHIVNHGLHDCLVSRAMVRMVAVLPRPVTRNTSTMAPAVVAATSLEPGGGAQAGSGEKMM